MMGLAEMDKWTAFIKQKTISTFMTNWRPLIDCLHEREKCIYNVILML